MSANLRACIEKLRMIAAIRDPELRRKVLTSLADDCLYKALNEIAINTVARKVPLTLKQKRRLRKFKVKIQNLTCKTNSNRKRKQLVAQSGGFLPILIPAIASVITSLIASKT